MGYVFRPRKNTSMMDPMFYDHNYQVQAGVGLSMANPYTYAKCNYAWGRFHEAFLFENNISGFDPYTAIEVGHIRRVSGGNTYYVWSSDGRYWYNANDYSTATSTYYNIDSQPRYELPYYLNQLNIGDIVVFTDTLQTNIIIAICERVTYNHEHDLFSYWDNNDGFILQEARNTDTWFGIIINNVVHHAIGCVKSPLSLDSRLQPITVGPWINWKLPWWMYKKQIERIKRGD